MSPETIEQQAIIEHDGGHLLVTAVAGSGKSHTLIRRIVRQMQRGTPKDRILPLMFNTSARDKFSERLEAVCLDASLPIPRVFTFHSFGLLLCSRLESAGVIPVRSLVTDQGDLIRYMRQAISEVNETLADDERIDLFGDAPAELLEVVEIVAGDLGQMPVDLPRTWQAVVTAFEALRDRVGFRMFAHMISDPVVALVSDPSLATKMGNRYDEILVDEFQDVNEAQMRLILYLAGTRARVIAVGDDDQCIYSWRGAKPEYILRRFEELFPGTKRLPLSRTFRFGSKIAAAANRVIAQNKTRIDKSIAANDEARSQIDIRMAQPWTRTGKDAAAAIAEWRAQGRSLADAALLVREYAITAAIEPDLVALGIPYRIHGAAPFFDRAVALALEGHIRLACKRFPSDSDGRWRMLRAMLTQPSLYLPFNLVDRIMRDASGHPEALPAAVRGMASHFSDFRRKRLQEAADNFAFALASDGRASAEQFVRSVLKRTDLISHLSRMHPRTEIARSHIALATEILAMSAQVHTVDSLLGRIEAMRAQYNALNEDEDHLQILSIHRAKGLEWPLVVLPELSDGVLPAIGSNGEISADDLEDERRLMYVAMTRARELLVLCTPLDAELEKWAKDGKSGHPMGRLGASRFLYEAGTALLAA